MRDGLCRQLGLRLSSYGLDNLVWYAVYAGMKGLGDVVVEADGQGAGFWVAGAGEGVRGGVRGYVARAAEG